MKASELLATLPDDLYDRDEALLRHVIDGHVVIDMVWIDCQNGLEIQIPRDALLFGDRDEAVRLGSTAYTEQLIVDHLGGVLLTPKLDDCVARAARDAGGLVAPQVQRITSSLAGYLRHSDAIDAQLQLLGAEAARVIAGWKNWCLTLDIWRKRGFVTNYGWHVPVGQAAPAPLVASCSEPELRVIQGPHEAHDTGVDFDGDGYADSGHGDYSQLIRWADRKARWQGNPVNLDAVLCGYCGAEATAAASHEGKLPGWRLPGVPRIGFTDHENPPRVTRLGEKGPDVEVWQKWLMRHGYALPRYGADGHHGAETETATLQWQADNDVEPDYPDEPEPDPEPIELVTLPDISFRQARYFAPGRSLVDFDPQPATPYLWIIIHTAEMLEVSHGAEALQEYCATMADGRVCSWWGAVDNNSITQSVQTHDTAYGAGPSNECGIHIELCGKAGQGKAGWDDEYSQAELKLAAALVAMLCHETGIPAIKRDEYQAVDLMPGIVGHDTITAASLLAKRRGVKRGPWWSQSRGKWRGTTHIDPGRWFDWPAFMRMVRAHLDVFGTQARLIRAGLA